MKCKTTAIKLLKLKLTDVFSRTYNRRVCKCEPLLRFNPLNLAKIVCFVKWVKGAKCVSSDFLNEKVLLILTCIILKIKAQLK